MKKYILIITTLFSLIAQSQNYKVIDNNTNLPVQYATLQIYDTGKFIAGFYSGEDGFINILDEFNFNEIKISCIGYETIVVPKNQYIIKLNQNVTILEEVVVTNKDFLNLGFINNQKSKNIIGVSDGLEVAVFINNEFDYPVKINSIQFNVKKIKSRVAYRIHLYKKSENNLYPKEELLIDNKIEYLEIDTKGLVNVNLSEYNIILPKEGVFLSIEGIGGNNTTSTKSKKNLIQFETHISELEIYQERNYKNNIGWININKWLPDNYKKTFNKEYDKRKLFVPSFGLKVQKIDAN